MTIRGDILDEAKRLTEGDRNKTYGDPYDNMRNFALLVTAHLRGKYGFEFDLTPEDGTVLMRLSKLARTYAGYHRDNYVDDVAYGAMAGECAALDSSAILPTDYPTGEED